MSAVLSERVAKMATTKTGLRIGVAHLPSQVGPTLDEEALQRAMLYEHTEPQFRLVTRGMAVALCVVVLAVVWGAL